MRASLIGAAATRKASLGDARGPAGKLFPPGSLLPWNCSVAPYLLISASPIKTSCRRKANAMPHSSLKFRWLENLSEVSRESWNALAEPLQTPFLEWDWLQLMEVSGSSGLETGWIPRHLTV